MSMLAVSEEQRYCAVKYVPNRLMNGDVGGPWWPNVHMLPFILLRLACILACNLHAYLLHYIVHTHP